MPPDIIQKIFLYAAEGKRRKRRPNPENNNWDWEARGAGASAANLKETVRFSSSRLSICYRLVRLNRTIASQMLHVADSLAKLIEDECMEINRLRLLYFTGKTFHPEFARVKTIAIANAAPTTTWLQRLTHVNAIWHERTGFASCSRGFARRKLDRLQPRD